MQLHLPRTRRAYVTSVLAGGGAFVFVIIVVHGLLTSLGMRAEATYLDDTLVAIAVGLLVLALEAHHETDMQAERERALLSLGLNHHIRNALQTIVYVSSSVADPHQAEMLSDAAKRIEWAIREVPKHAQAQGPSAELTTVDWNSALAQSALQQKAGDALNAPGGRSAVVQPPADK